MRHKAQVKIVRIVRVEHFGQLCQFVTGARTRREFLYETRCGPAGAERNPARAVPNAPPVEVAMVATKKLIAAIAGEADGDVSTSYRGFWLASTSDSF